ncbi:MAG TPA: hypothetical protein VIG70_10270 [Burkholderiales bacterium]|jgi:hypothetical protein
MTRSLVLALAFLAAEAAACGYCVEDKIASTYDHAVVTRALAQGHHVVFFHIDGPPATQRELENAAASVPGVERGSVRLSLPTLTLSVAFDPRRVSLVELNARLDRRLAARKLSFMPMRIMEEPADLKTVKR